MEWQCWQAGSTVRRWQATELHSPWHCSPGLLTPGGNRRGHHTRPSTAVQTGRSTCAAAQSPDPGCTLPRELRTERCWGPELCRHITGQSAPPSTHLTSSKNLSSSRKETSEYLGEKQDRRITGGGRREEWCEGLLCRDTRITRLDASPGLMAMAALKSPLLILTSTVLQADPLSGSLPSPCSGPVPLSSPPPRSLASDLGQRQKGAVSWEVL